MRLLCFTNAGNEENVYTNEGLGARRVPALLEWCRAHQVEMLAPQLPGRARRSKEPYVEDAQVRDATRCSADGLCTRPPPTSEPSIVSACAVRSGAGPGDGCHPLV